VHERHAPAPATELLPSAANACSTLGIRTRAADSAWSGFGARGPGSFAGPPCRRARGHPRRSCPEGCRGPGPSSPRPGPQAARVTTRPAGRLGVLRGHLLRPGGLGPCSSRGIAAAVPADDPSPDHFGAAGVNGRVPGPHSFDCVSARRRDCQPLTVRLQLRQTGGWRPGGPRIDGAAACPRSSSTR
jgi:hypothetical protein